MPRALISGISALTVSASSRNSRPATPAGLTISGVALQRQPDEGDGHAVVLAHLVGREERFAGRLHDRAGGEILELGAEEGMRSLAAVDRMAAAVLHALQLVRALVELMVADGGDVEAHHRQRLDGRLVVEQRGQKRARTDQVAGGDEDAVLLAFAALLDQRRQMLGAAGGHRYPLRLVGRIGDADAARRRLQVAVEVVQREDRQVDRRAAEGEARARDEEAGRDQHQRRDGRDPVAKTHEL